ncbi:hypothetical protein LY78DRAFT_2748 [Colletotrichum sublineola]|nr:hypothetical protein LY78DRAFT_2748 [Colletotrichum sublineola]
MIPLNPLPDLLASLIFYLIFGQELQAKDRHIPLCDSRSMEKGRCLTNSLKAKLFNHKASFWSISRGYVWGMVIPRLRKATRVASCHEWR